MCYLCLGVQYPLTPEKGVESPRSEVNVVMNHRVSDGSQALFSGRAANVLYRYTISLQTLYLAFVVVLFFLIIIFNFFIIVCILPVSVHHVDTGGQKKVSDLPWNCRYRWF